MDKINKPIDDERTCDYCYKQFIKNDESVCVHRPVPFGVRLVDTNWESIFSMLEDWYCDSDCAYMQSMREPF